MLKERGPAVAGLFFALFITWGISPQPRKLSHAGQSYFRAFLEAFTPLVLKHERSGKGGNYRWGDKNRDCAGLVRYLFWEAMQTHDEVFGARYPELSQLIQSPHAGEFTRISRDWSVSNYTAAQLRTRVRSVGRSVPAELLRSGDLLFFESPELRIRHTMLLLRSGAGIYLVYHTGDERNELRIRTLDDLKVLPGTEWHPEAANPVFQGFFRPQFLD